MCSAIRLLKTIPNSNTALLTSIRYEIGAATIAGYDPDRPNKVNQDAYFAWQTTTTTTTSTSIHSSSICKNNVVRVVLGVLDGHGRNGEIVSGYLQKRLSERLQQYLKIKIESSCCDNNNNNNNDCPEEKNNEEEEEFDKVVEQQRHDLMHFGLANPTEFIPSNKDSIHQALIDAFFAAHVDARRTKGIPTGRSGSTGIVCVIVEGQDVTGDCINHVPCNTLYLYTAIVGDSRAILVTQTPEKSIWTTQSLANVTTVNLPEERDRVEKAKGRIDVSGNVFYGPVGIAMSRALGDSVLLPAGVLPIPIVTRQEIFTVMPQTVYYIILGSDGIFDVLTDTRVSEILHHSSDNDKSMDAVAMEVCAQAKIAWLGGLPIETRIDDITLVIAKCTIS